MGSGAALPMSGFNNRTTSRPQFPHLLQVRLDKMSKVPGEGNAEPGVRAVRPPSMAPRGRWQPREPGRTDPRRDSPTLRDSAKPQGPGLALEVIPASPSTQVRLPFCNRPQLLRRPPPSESQASSASKTEHALSGAGSGLRLLSAFPTEVRGGRPRGRSCGPEGEARPGPEPSARGLLPASEPGVACAARWHGLCAYAGGVSAAGAGWAPCAPSGEPGQAVGSRGRWLRRPLSGPGTGPHDPAPCGPPHARAAAACGPAGGGRDCGGGAGASGPALLGRARGVFLLPNPVFR